MLFRSCRLRSQLMWMTSPGTDLPVASRPWRALRIPRNGNRSSRSPLHLQLHQNRLRQIPQAIPSRLVLCPIRSAPTRRLPFQRIRVLLKSIFSFVVTVSWRGFTPISLRSTRSSARTRSGRILSRRWVDSKNTFRTIPPPSRGARRQWCNTPCSFRRISRRPT